MAQLFFPSGPAKNFDFGTALIQKSNFSQAEPNGYTMFTLYLKTADSLICFASSKLSLANYSVSSASELKGQIFMI